MTTRIAESPEHLTKTRNAASRSPFLEAISEGLFEEMERDERVFLLGEDIGVYGGAFKVTRGFLDISGGERVIDTPIAEGGLHRRGGRCGAHGAPPGGRDAVHGLHLSGVRRHHELHRDLAVPRRRADAARDSRARWAAATAAGRSTRRTWRWRSSTPRASRSCTRAPPYDAKGLLKAAIRDDNPVIFEEHKGLYRAPELREVLPDEDYLVPLGKARTVREGATSRSSPTARWCTSALEAAERLDAEDGVAVEILDLRTLLPLDDDAIVESVKKTGRLLVVHEDTRTGGIAGEIAMRVSERAFEWLDAPILRVTAIDAPVPYSGPLEDYFLPQTDDIVTARPLPGRLLRTRRRAGWPAAELEPRAIARAARYDEATAGRAVSGWTQQRIRSDRAWLESKSRCPRWGSPSPREPSPSGSSRSATP